MKSEKGLTLLKFTVICVVLSLIVGVTAYVALQDNGPVDTYITNKISNNVEENTVADN